MSDASAFDLVAHARSWARRGGSLRRLYEDATDHDVPASDVWLAWCAARILEAPYDARKSTAEPRV